MNATIASPVDISTGLHPGRSARVCASAWDRKAASAAFTVFKDSLLEPAIAEIKDERLARIYRLAAIEAEALAWQTPCPFLFLPALLEEKLEEVRRYALQQERYQKGYDCLKA